MCLIIKNMHSIVPSIRRQVRPYSFKASRNFLCSSSDHLSLCFVIVYGFLTYWNSNNGLVEKRVISLFQISWFMDRRRAWRMQKRWKPWERNHFRKKTDPLVGGQLQNVGQNSKIFHCWPGEQNVNEHPHFHPIGKRENKWH